MKYTIGGHSGRFAEGTTEEEAITELQFWIKNDSLSYLGIKTHKNTTAENLDNAASTEATYIQLGTIDGVLTYIFY